MGNDKDKDLKELGEGLGEGMTMTSFGEAGKAGEGGEGGKAGEGGEGGEAGKAGEGGEAGKAGEGGEAGKAGEGGEAGKAGEGGEAGKAGEGGEAGKAGEGGEAGKAGEGGEAGKGIKSPDISGDVGVTTLLSETLGGKYKNVEELKAADIPGKLKELEELRDANATLKTQAENPVAGFVNDDVAKFNQFVKDTGTNDYVMFDKLNKANLENMDSMDALVLKQIIDNPKLIGQETRVKKMLVKKYNINPDDVKDEKLSQDDFELNQLNMEAEAGKAQKGLVELKGKIRMPEKPEPPVQTIKPPTKEELELNREKWGTVSGVMFDAVKELPFYPEGKENKDGTKNEPFKFAVTAESTKEVHKMISDFCVENQLEPNEKFIASFSPFILGLYVSKNANFVLKSHMDTFAEKVKKEVAEVYEHPSALKTGEQAEIEKLDDDGVQKAFDAEMKDD